jgi:hypothetical protein
MSPDRRIKRTIRRELERQQRTGKSSPEQKPRKFVKFVWFLLGIPSIYVGLLSLLPRISVSVQAPLTAADPFSSPFVVSNDGYLTLYNVKCSCSPRQVTYKKPNRRGRLDITTEGPEESETGWLHVKLDCPDSRSTSEGIFSVHVS